MINTTRSDNPGLLFEKIKEDMSVFLTKTEAEMEDSFEKTVFLEKITILEQDISLFLTKKEYLKEKAQRLLLRRWAFACLNEAAHKLKKAKKEILSNAYSDGIHLTLSACLWGYQGCKIIEIYSLIKDIEKNLHHYHITPDHVRKGDIILSYKTDDFLKKDILSKLVAVLTNSPVTHSLIAINDKHTETKLHDFLQSNPESHGLSIKNETPRKGELYLVFRLDETLSPISEAKLRSAVETWTKLAKPHYKRYHFAETKSWFACIIGFLYISSCYIFLRPICLKNPIKDDSTVFCSEVIDLIFRRAGIPLTPRSDNYAVIGPAEIVYSPYLKFEGIIANKDDLNTLKEEVSKRFMLTFLYKES